MLVGDTLLKNIGFIEFCLLLITLVNVAIAATDLAGRVVGIHGGQYANVKALFEA
jgi:hypothetical protein